MVVASKEMIRPLLRQIGQLPSRPVDPGWLGLKFETIRWSGGLSGSVVHWFTLYDTSVQDVDAMISTDMVALGLSRKK